MPEKTSWHHLYAAQARTGFANLMLSGRGMFPKTHPRLDHVDPAANRPSHGIHEPKQLNPALEQARRQAPQPKLSSAEKSFTCCNQLPIWITHAHCA